MTAVTVLTAALTIIGSSCLYYYWLAATTAKRTQAHWISILPRLLRPHLTHSETAAAAYKHGPILLQYLGPFKHIIVCDAKIANYMLKHDDVYIKMAVPTAPSIAKYCGSTIMNTNGEIYQLHRQLVAKFLNHASVNSFRSRFQQQVDKLVVVLAQQLVENHSNYVTHECTVDISKYMAALTLDVLGSTILGINMGSLDNSSGSSNSRTILTIKDAIAIFTREITNPLHIVIPFYEKLTFLQSNRELRDSLVVINNYVNKLLVERANKNSTKQTDYNILDDMIDNHLLSADNNQSSSSSSSSVNNGSGDDKKSGKISLAAAFGNIINLMIAGYDTTAISLSWILYFLAINPNIQDRLYEEIVTDSDEKGGLAFMSTTLLGRVIKESLRLMPPVAIAPTRTCTEDQQLPFTNPHTGQAYIIPKGSIISYSVWAIHRDPKLWLDPDSFNPDRWLSPKEDDDSARQFNEREVFLPFSAGRRPCLGREFSLVEQKIVLIALLKKFRILPAVGDSADSVPHLKSGIFSAPENVTVKLQLRQ